MSGATESGKRTLIYRNAEYSDTLPAMNTIMSRRGRNGLRLVAVLSGVLMCFPPPAAVAVSPVAAPRTVTLQVEDVSGGESAASSGLGTVPSSSETVSTGGTATVQFSSARTAVAALRAPTPARRGCTRDRTTVALSPDNTAVTVTHSDMVAESSPGVRSTGSTVTCSLKIKLSIPAGYTYAISRVDYRGYASLEDGSSARHTGSFSFVGSATTRATTPFRGPLHDNWMINNEATRPSYAVPILSLQTTLSVSAKASANGSPGSFIAMDSTDASFESMYHIAWATC
jgi:Domain of unknown function (DUF4360)